MSPEDPESPDTLIANALLPDSCVFLLGEDYKTVLQKLGVPEDSIDRLKTVGDSFGGSYDIVDEDGFAVSISTYGGDSFDLIIVDDTTVHVLQITANGRLAAINHVIQE